MELTLYLSLSKCVQVKIRFSVFFFVFICYFNNLIQISCIAEDLEFMLSDGTKKSRVIAMMYSKHGNVFAIFFPQYYVPLVEWFVCPPVNRQVLGSIPDCVRSKMLELVSFPPVLLELRKGIAERSVLVVTVTRTGTP